MNTAISWIRRLGMQRHAEGGWYKEVYRSSLQLPAGYLKGQFQGSRSTCTHIYFLLERGDFSAFHRIRSDELWHFYDGSPLNIFEIGVDGLMREHRIGHLPGKDQMPFTMITAGNWFGSRIEGSGEYSLVGCTVSPGFDFTDFELADRSRMLKEYPRYETIITSLTRL